VGGAVFQAQRYGHGPGIGDEIGPLRDDGALFGSVPGIGDQDPLHVLTAHGDPVGVQENAAEFVVEDLFLDPDAGLLPGQVE